MATDTTSKIYTFKNVKVLIADTVYPVSSVTLYLQETSIPQLRLTLDPAHTWGVNETDRASQADLMTASQWLEPLLKLAEKKVDTTLFTLDVYESNTTNAGPAQQLKLENWILNAAGLTGVSATGRFSLAVELLHPIASLQEGGMNIGSIFGKYSKGMSAVAAENIPGAIVEILNAYSGIIITDPAIDSMATSGLCGAPDVPIETYVTTFQTRLVTLAADLAQHLKWDTTLISNTCNAWPLSCIDRESSIKNSLAGYILGGLVETNLWEILARHICGQWCVSIIPTFWESYLTMVPFTPWDSPCIDIHSKVISDIDFPSADPTPIAGTWISYSKAAVNPDWAYFLDENSINEITFSGMGYIPSIEAKGQVANVQAPGWYSNMLGNDAAAAGAVTEPATQETNFTDDIVSPNGIAYDDQAAVTPNNGVTSLEHEAYRDGLYVIAKQLFLTYFRQETVIRINCPLLITYSGADTDAAHHMIPGVTAQVLNEDDSTAFVFHVIGVTHNIDCQEGTAGTVISGTYTRPSGAYPGSVEDPEANPMYSL